MHRWLSMLEKKEKKTSAPQSKGTAGSLSEKPSVCRLDRVAWTNTISILMSLSPSFSLIQNLLHQRRIEILTTLLQHREKGNRSGRLWWHEKIDLRLPFKATLLSRPQKVLFRCKSLAKGKNRITISRRSAIIKTLNYQNHTSDVIGSAKNDLTHLENSLRNPLQLNPHRLVST